MAKSFRSALTQADLFKAATVTLVADEFITVGARVIKAKEMLSLGFGENSTQEGANGRIFMNFKDNGVSPGLDVDGLVRFTIYTPNGHPVENGIIAEFRTETLRTSTSDRQLQIPFPEDYRAVTEDHEIRLELKADAGATLDKANSKFLIDTTLFYV